MGRHAGSIELGRAFGATDIVSERGEEGMARVRDLTKGLGAHSVLECVGTSQAMDTSVGIVRAGGAIGRVGVPHYETVPAALPLFYKNVTVGGGPAPVRAYIDELLPDVLEGRIEPGRVFDSTVDLDGYRAMDGRKSIKVMVKP
jgi:threonine dehydrogenase-like Zn-dependent dehydrogenase